MATDRPHPDEIDKAKITEVRNALVTGQLAGIGAVEGHLLDDINQGELAALLGAMTAMTANVVRAYSQHLGIDALEWWQAIIEIDNSAPRDPDDE